MTDCLTEGEEMSGDDSVARLAEAAWPLQMHSAEDECLTSLLQVAAGRIGGQLAPWLDERLLLSQGLCALLETMGDDCSPLPAQSDHDGWSQRLRIAVRGMRNWARASCWFTRAWACRVAPLCAALWQRGDGKEAEVARDLGMEPQALAGRYTEAGLLFGVSPDLILPTAAVTHSGGAEQSLLAGAVSSRPVEQRRVLTLYFGEGLSFPEIAELLGRPPATVQETYGRAATAIRAHLLGAGG